MGEFNFPFIILHFVNLQSTVQLGLDFLSPESLREALKLAEEIRGLPSDHDAKLQILEVAEEIYFWFPVHLLYRVFHVYRGAFSYTIL